MFTFQDVVYKDILGINHLSIDKEQVTCLVGESGTGKSTLLKLMNNMVSATSGTISYKHNPVEEMNPVVLRRDISMLSQTPVLFGETIKENLEAGLLFAEKSPADDKKLIDAMNYFYLHKDLDEKAETLSGGEQQRLALARMILLDSPVFLLDEPTSALDEDLEHEVMKQFIDHARNHKKTVIFVTHSKAIAKEFSDRIVDITPFSKKGSVKLER
ncbi:ATP-binding cassette domain-containing protein [Alteribacillus sp. JSM 102045]|uniref:ABC transporter ATP-binding protein n=1 Tax=Alteribacillus sp. JSM 102045 TaxID=1562101 RepID=UPI0035C0616E